ncbi:MAG: DUF3307 domain-containing protein [Pseudomonadota bacterium]
MIETFVALICAHVLADYVLQPGWMVKRKRNPFVLLLHGLVVLAVSLATLGHIDAPPVIALAMIHVVIDATKIYGFSDTLTAHLMDQVAHLGTILFVSIYAPDLWQTGAWSGHSDWVLHLLLILSGAVLVTRAGGLVMEKLMSRFSQDFVSDGLPQGGRLIGILERGLIFVLILSGQAEGVGFLIAAKSILRFEIASKQKAAEYVIIGTLASFGWAIMIANATAFLLHRLPPLVIGPAVN